MKCIFCLEERPESDEHVFPLAIGGALIIKRVCETCNSELGRTADAPLSNHLFVVFQRSPLKLPGNSGAVPDAMRALFGTGVMANDHDQKIRLMPDGKGALRPHVIYKATDITLPDGRSARSITLDASTTEREVRKIIDRERKRAGLPGISDTEFTPLLRDIESGIRTHENPEVLLQPRIDIVEFKRGLLKIAYELAWLWLGESYLDDPVGARLRDVLKRRT